MQILEYKAGPVEKEEYRGKERKVGGMTYKPIELRPLGGRTLRAENQDENVGE